MKSIIVILLIAVTYCYAANVLETVIGMIGMEKDEVLKSLPNLKEDYKDTYSLESTAKVYGIELREIVFEFKYDQLSSVMLNPLLDSDMKGCLTVGSALREDYGKVEPYKSMFGTCWIWKTYKVKIILFEKKIGTHPSSWFIFIEKRKADE